VLVHRLFHPEEVESLEAFGQLERLQPRVIVIRIEHQRHVRPEGFADGSAGSDVALGVGRAGNGRLPGMRLEGRVAALFAPQGEPGIGLGGVEAPLEVVADHRAGIRGHPVPGSAQQPLDGLAERLAGQVPQREVHPRQHAIGQRAQIQALPLDERLPDALAVKGVLPEQHRLHYVLDGALVDGSKVVATHAVVGRYREQRLDRVVLWAGVSVPLGVSYDARPVAKLLDRDVRDLHTHCSPGRLCGHLDLNRDHGWQVQRRGCHAHR